MTFSTDLPDGAPAAPAEALALISDALAWPLLMLRRDASLVHANLAARQLLKRGRPLLLNAQRQVLPAPAAQRAAYQGLLAEVAAAGPGRPPEMLLWADPGGPVSLSLAALHVAAQSHPLLLLALNPELGRVADLRAYAAVNGLSDAETRVLLYLARGCSSAKAAAELGVSPATVRSQTVALRRKTGHTSVSALMRTLAALPPLVPADGEK